MSGADPKLQGFYTLAEAVAAIIAHKRARRRAIRDARSEI
jgi:hypothetical protein